MPLLRQLEFGFERSIDSALVGQALRLPHPTAATETVALQFRARELLRSLGAPRLARELRVEWNCRLQTAAGRADYREKLILLNPRLREHGEEEIEGTLRHELAQLLAQFPGGRRRV